jgi:hypothetical protein
MRFPVFLILILVSSGCLTASAAVTKETVRAKTDECWTAHWDGKNASITDVVCPSGDFYAESLLPNTKGRLCTSIYTQLAFAEIDTDAMKWEVQLQDRRSVDIESWLHEIRTTTEAYQRRYAGICDIGQVAQICETASTDTFPETICQDLGKRKADAWEKMGYILAGRGIAKTFQNDKDTFIDATKGKYIKIADKWTQYLTYYQTAVAKFTAYLKTVVK